ncbi:hypothetical protein J3R30DRAFT_3499420 [Lentinula aciculospora]|uniref:Uncharacterized protein n=1 Tax=Lentinula aciculospora TaxID=153920 RepID=A0A9W9A8R8_9AGAR|nr:hypothetical protein J3R30DRAFT_3499420 [Lentinula aciculospora]
MRTYETLIPFVTLALTIAANAAPTTYSSPAGNTATARDVMSSPDGFLEARSIVEDDFHLFERAPGNNISDGRSLGGVFPRKVEATPHLPTGPEHPAHLDTGEKHPVAPHFPTEPEHPAHPHTGEKQPEHPAAPHPHPEAAHPHPNVLPSLATHPSEASAIYHPSNRHPLKKKTSLKGLLAAGAVGAVIGGAAVGGVAYHLGETENPGTTSSGNGDTTTATTGTTGTTGGPESSVDTTAGTDTTSASTDMTSASTDMGDGTTSMKRSLSRSTFRRRVSAWELD